VDAAALIGREDSVKLNEITVEEKVGRHWNTAHPVPKKGNRDERHRFYQQRCDSLCQKGNIRLAT